ncbi:MAG: hypothetical protein AAFR79_12655 [Pseudomonadota bacterium]
MTRREKILEALKRAGHALPTGEIARRIRDDKTEVATELRALCDLGSVRLDRDGRYTSTAAVEGNALAVHERASGARTTVSARSTEDAQRQLDAILSAEARYRDARNPQPDAGR